MGKKTKRQTPASAGARRGGKTARIPGQLESGLVKKSVYLYPDEAEVLRKRAFDDQISESLLFRIALRKHLGLPPLEG